jgi:hypothetical protein
MFRDMGLGDHLHFIDATDTFLAALKGKVEPEAKRRAIGDTFITVFESEARRLGITGHLLGQGTIYPDTIETGGTKRADTIKTHHNRVPIIEEMIKAGKVVEPLADLYKVEVRELGEKLGIPHDMIWRHPFPGPGLGVRSAVQRRRRGRRGHAGEDHPRGGQGRCGLRPAGDAAADPLGGREGRPAHLRTPGAAARAGLRGRRRVRLGRAGRGLGHHLQVGGRTQPRAAAAGRWPAHSSAVRWPRR